MGMNFARYQSGEYIKFSDMATELEFSGWVPYYNKIDADYVKTLECDCGLPLRYRGFRNERLSLYRFFAVCEECDCFEQFSD